MALMDRRRRKTQAAIMDAFARLLADHDLRDINVLQICEEADVARSSFYAHFDNKRELVIAAMNRLEKSLVDTIDPAYTGRFGFLPGLLDHIALRRETGTARSRLLLEPTMLDEFRSFVAKLVGQSLMDRDGESHGPSLAAFVAGGVLGAIQSWLENNCEQEPASLALDIENMTSRICA